MRNNGENLTPELVGSLQAEIVAVASVRRAVSSREVSAKTRMRTLQRQRARARKHHELLDPSSEELQAAEDKYTRLKALRADLGRALDNLVLARNTAELYVSTALSEHEEVWGDLHNRFTVGVGGNGTADT